MEPRLPKLLQRAWRIDCKAKIIITDMESLAIFHPRSPNTAGEVLYEFLRVANLSVIRIILAAYLHNTLPEGIYIDIRPQREALDKMVPAGAPSDPQIPMESDEEVFATRRCHTDFDYYALTHDRDRALQFFRWKTWVKENCSHVVTSSGDVLTGITHGFSRRNAELKPYYPLDTPPVDTLEHVASVRRPCPMAVRSLLDEFNSSETFTLELLEDLTQAQNSGLCRTFTCRIASINGRAVGGISPVLCVKFFDDRFYPMQYPDDEMLEGDFRWWWAHYTTSERQIQNEDATYKRLALMQGSLIPRFYGSHQVNGIYILN